MKILGINAYHGDSSAAIVVDGELVAAAEEERFRRIKHWAGFPSESIDYCLRSASIDIGDVDHVAINQNSKANLHHKILFALKNPRRLNEFRTQFKNRKARDGVAEQLTRCWPDNKFLGKIHHIEHHYAHMSSAFFVSPFEEAAIVSVDGFGDFSSATWGTGMGTNINIDGRVLFPHSLGIFYQSLTQYLGFPHYGDEYKIMGLAPYGEPVLLNRMKEIVKLLPNGGFELDLSYFNHHCNGVAYDWNDGAPVVGRLFSENLEKLLGPSRKSEEPIEGFHHDVARSVQAMYEEAFFHMLDSLHTKCKLDAITVSGGCGMNSVANGKILERTPFKEVYVQSAAGDAGGAIGAAFATYHRFGLSRKFVMDHSYWGPRFSNDDIQSLLKERESELNINRFVCTKYDNEQELCDLVAADIAEGKVIGWFQGRMEWGPRALGNRSILGDPRRDDMKEILNLKIKRRESFRPFAPSILREKVADWFETDADVPFMMSVFQIKPEKRSEIPAVTHVDGSGRLQTVTEETNARYHRLIRSFEGITNVPLILNTSFNENEPVVCTPLQALDCFLRTSMDVLVLEDWVLSR